MRANKVVIKATMRTDWVSSSSLAGKLGIHFLELVKNEAFEALI